jgi:hypothetical protein
MPPFDPAVADRCGSRPRNHARATKHQAGLKTRNYEPLTREQCGRRPRAYLPESGVPPAQRAN